MPIGLVAEVGTIYFGSTEYLVGFRLTEAGERYGLPIAAYLLEKSRNLPFSLLEIFGPTSKGRGETRSVINRAKILEQLSVANSALRCEDLAKQLGLDSVSIGGHLKKFDQLGLVGYQSVNTEEKGQFTYTIVESARKMEVRPVRHHPTLTKEVANLLLTWESVDSNFLYLALRDKYPKTSEKSLRQRLSQILAGLARQGICRPETFIGGEVQSSAEIADFGRQIVAEIILPVKQVLANDLRLLSSWQTVPWQNFAKEATLKYKEASGNARQQPVEQWAGKALTLIYQRPGIRPGELTSQLGRNSADLLRFLLAQAKIRKQRQGMAVRYYPIDTF